MKIPGDFTHNHRQALMVLREGRKATEDGWVSDFSNQRWMKTAMHDLWRFGWAERGFEPSLKYRLKEAA